MTRGERRKDAAIIDASASEKSSNRNSLSGVESVIECDERTCPAVQSPNIRELETRRELPLRKSSDTNSQHANVNTRQHSIRDEKPSHPSERTLLSRRKGLVDTKGARPISAAGKDRYVETHSGLSLTAEATDNCERDEIDYADLAKWIESREARKAMRESLQCVWSKRREKD